MDKKILENLAEYLEKFISNEVKKRCKELEEAKDRAEWNEKCYKGWLHFLIKDNSIDLNKLYKEAEKEYNDWTESDAHNGLFGWSKERMTADDRKHAYQNIKKFYEGA